MDGHELTGKNRWMRAIDGAKAGGKDSAANHAVAQELGVNIAKTGSTAMELLERLGQ